MTQLRILRLAAGGDGVGRLEDGRTVFVPRTAPGDLVELTGIREHKRFARARLARVLEPSPHRVEPRCPHYVRDHCGGCQLQHVDYDTQLESRRAFVGEALRRMAKLDTSDPPVTPATRAYDYRTKLTLHAQDQGRRIGLHRYGRPDQIFDLQWCHITVPRLMELWQTVRTLRSLLPRNLAQLVLRLDRLGNTHLIIRVGEGEVWSESDQLHQQIQRRGTPATLWYQPSGGVPRALGRGDPFPATVFEQVHPEMGDQVREFAVQQLGTVAGLRVWDLYAGIGETTALLAARGARVESVELDRRAVNEAESNGPSASRHAGRVEDLLDRLGPPDLVIINPPRTGMHQRVTAELNRRRPARLVYISCDPATLARDLQRLHNFRLAGVRAFDLFPQTAHVEAVALLEAV